MLFPPLKGSPNVNCLSASVCVLEVTYLLTFLLKLA